LLVIFRDLVDSYYYRDCSGNPKYHSYGFAYPTQVMLFLVFIVGRLKVLPGPRICKGGNLLFSLRR
jgi:hypothetical protein